MNREQLAHIVRAAAVIARDGDMVIIGSQSILGSYEDTDLPAKPTFDAVQRISDHRRRGKRPVGSGAQVNHSGWDRSPRSVRARHMQRTLLMTTSSPKGLLEEQCFESRTPDIVNRPGFTCPLATGTAPLRSGG